MLVPAPTVEIFDPAALPGRIASQIRSAVACPAPNSGLMGHPLTMNALLTVTSRHNGEDREVLDLWAKLDENDQVHFIGEVDLHILPYRPYEVEVHRAFASIEVFQRDYAGKMTIGTLLSHLH